jgi:hypothetical protein
MKLVNLRAPEDSYEQWKTAASSAGMTWSAWVREALDEKAGLRGREREAAGTAGPSRSRNTRKKEPVAAMAASAGGTKRSYTPDFKRPKR